MVFPKEFHRIIFCHAEINSFHLEGQPLSRCQFNTDLKRCLDIMGVDTFRNMTCFYLHLRLHLSVAHNSMFICHFVHTCMPFAQNYAYIGYAVLHGCAFALIQWT